MAYHKILIGIGTAAVLSMLVFGCSTRTIDSNVGLADAGAPSSSTAALCGTWQGSFWHVIGDHTSSPGSSDLTLQVSGDSTYTFKWGNRPPSTGTIAARGTRVILDDESGSQITLVHSGDSLHGVMQDRMNGWPTMMKLQKQESPPSRFAGIHPRC